MAESGKTAAASGGVNNSNTGWEVHGGFAAYFGFGGIIAQTKGRLKAQFQTAFLRFAAGQVLKLYWQPFSATR